ncbi:MAG: VWA domain-containing protein [Deltaproteobacteria bacterium]|jgi:Ca-activated chloride channel family protein|nr:VWA domain-containing protein [Deltaproteobacteria bacterium]
MPPKSTLNPESKGSKTKTIFLVLSVLVAILLIGAIVIVAKNSSFFRGSDNHYEGLSELEANRLLNELYKTINVTTLPPINENVDSESMTMMEILPEIDQFPLAVSPISGTLWLELFSSSEKATDSENGTYNRWLMTMGKKFNALKPSIKGQPVSIAIRPIPSGLAMDYIASGKHVPDAFSPSNVLWGEALRAQGLPVKLMAEKLVGNVAGIVIKNSKIESFLKKYQKISVDTVVKAVNDETFIMGYANPLVSSTGANFLMSLLCETNPNDPLSSEAVASFEKFQRNIPFVAYTTLQMTQAAKSGLFDGFVFEYQQFANSPELKKDYTFTPFGVRHDNPVYALRNPSREKIELLTMFIAYCNFPESQKLALDYGFNQNADYPGVGQIKGQYLTEALKLYKARKSGDREVMAVLVADNSGSMEGPSIRLLKRSLIQGSKAINSNNFVGLVLFSDQTQIAVPINKFDLTQRSIFAGAVNNMSVGGGTAMYDAIIVAAKMLQDAKAKYPRVKPIIIVLTDGDSDQGHTFQDIAQVMRGLKIPIHTIGYKADIKALKDISAINEAATMKADIDDIVYQMQSFFAAEM